MAELFFTDLQIKYAEAADLRIWQITKRLLVAAINIPNCRT